MSGMIKLTANTVILHTDTPKDVGSRMVIEVKLPEGVLLKSFTINGTITGCEPIKHNGSKAYMLEMKIGDMSQVNKRILEAYVDFLVRGKQLSGIRIDIEGLQDACNDFGEKLAKLRKTAEEVRNNLRGTLELVKRNSGRKTTIH